MKIIEDLKQRGILKDVTNIEKFENMDSNAVIYAGFDPTAKSLHLGNFIQILTLLRLKKAGIKVLALVGGATGMIGDPTFRSSERVLLDKESILINKNAIINQLKSYGLDVFDNLEFYKEMNVLEFLRDAGTSINVSYMLAKDSIATRLENGLSFTEFSYTLIQGWDFYKLYKDKNVHGQFGGSDQWGNITSGLEIISKKEGNDHKAFAFTCNLLTDANGNKFGKSTGGGSLWLDKEMTKPYDMYQFLLNQPDSEIEKLLKWLTFLSLDQIKEIVQEHNKNPQLRLGQKTLAYEVIKNVHNEKEANNAKSLSSILFDKNLKLSDISIEDITDLENDMKILVLDENKNLVDELISKGILKSKREAREFIEKGSIKFNLDTIEESFIIKSLVWDSKYALLHIGKKNIFLVKIK
ncbi:tyrosyl-tRNA synthetase [Mycoplasmopsis canis PG 14]|uniref:Tyrosine--tRNA ligase n=1 Tax=Mycoplasmopsis canis TaxID=29555 RepID=A0A449AQF7_9BACT|nr:tyrosine--tRNA ligase [Mycoplasmopsis canis]AMD80970.1 tyrosine--tRNA ligase [Mycoplasmopsis canis PG 14]EIE41094.1 tyrosyl-tRNA synthetase [Mycoplasmopsis canis PG 14]VEU68572.1 tyrosyl tRNA synthetase [Mycoplasmopsis canis]